MNMDDPKESELKKEEVSADSSQDLEPQVAPGELREKIIAGLKKCYDPEIPVDIYELGLIYDIKVNDDQSVFVKMTLTSPNCPVAESLPMEVEGRVKAVPGVKKLDFELTFEPPWNMDMMSEAAKLQLNMM